MLYEGAAAAGNTLKFRLQRSFYVSGHTAVRGPLSFKPAIPGRGRGAVRCRMRL